MNRLALAAGAAAVLLLGTLVAAQAPQGGRGGGAPGAPAPFVAYPQRPPGDPAAIARGKALYGVNCTFCHGAELRGGDGGGPNLLRSTVVLEDRMGELIAPIVLNGRGTMPKFQLTPEQIADLAEYFHSFSVSSRTGPVDINILVGDARRGSAYVAQKCSTCHTAEALRATASKLADNKALQQMWLMPGSGGGRGGGVPPIPAPPVRVVVTLPTGAKVEGRLQRVDDFGVALIQDDGVRRSFRTVGTTLKVDIIDPLQPHKDLLPQYTDRDIHDVTAYLASLR